MAVEIEAHKLADAVHCLKVLNQTFSAFQIGTGCILGTLTQWAFVH